MPVLHAVVLHQLRALHACQRWLHLPAMATIVLTRLPATPLFFLSCSYPGNYYSNKRWEQEHCLQRDPVIGACAEHQEPHA